LNGSMYLIFKKKAKIVRSLHCAAEHSS